jgi:hypothetical protein
MREPQSERLDPRAELILPVLARRASRETCPGNRTAHFRAPQFAVFCLLFALFALFVASFFPGRLRWTLPPAGP